MRLLSDLIYLTFHNPDDLQIEKKIQQAVSDYTSPRDLEILAKDDNLPVKLAVIRNPKIPLQLLEHFSEEDDYRIIDEILYSNQITSELLEKIANRIMNNENWNTHDRITILYKICNSDTANTHTLRQIWNKNKEHQSYMATKLSRNPNTPPDVIEEVIYNGNGDLFALNRHPNITPETAQIVKKELKAQFRVKEKNIKTEKLEQYLDCHHIEVKKKLANHPNSSLQILEKLSQDHDVNVRITLAQNRKSTPSILNTITFDGNTDIKREVAKHPNVTSDILERLSSETDTQVLISICEHDNTPITVLNKLVDTNNEQIWEAVAKNPNTSYECMRKLYEKNNLKIKIQLVSNHNVHQDILSRIYADLRNTENEDTKTCLSMIAKHRNTSNHILRDMMNRKKPWIDYGLAENNNTPIEYLERLAEADIEQYGPILLRNLNIPSELILNILSNPNIVKRNVKLINGRSQYNLLEHPNITPAILEMIVAQYDGELAMKALQKIDNIDCLLRLRLTAIESMQPQIIIRINKLKKIK